MAKGNKILSNAEKIRRIKSKMNAQQQEMFDDCYNATEHVGNAYEVYKLLKYL